LSSLSTDKLNLRLIRASTYLSRYPLNVRYKPDRQHIVPDILSRLASTNCLPSDPSEVTSLDYLYNFHIALVEISPDFRTQILRGYKDDKRWSKILKQLKSDHKLGPDHATNLPFILEKELIYHIDHEDHRRLYIPRSILKEVFELVYNQVGHPKYHRTHTRIVEYLYIHRLPKRLHKYIRHCPKCQINKIPRYKSYGDIVNTHTVDIILYNYV